MLDTVNQFISIEPDKHGLKFLIPISELTSISKYLIDLGYSSGNGYSCNWSPVYKKHFDFEVYIDNTEIITCLKIKYGNYFLDQF